MNTVDSNGSSRTREQYQDIAKKRATEQLKHSRMGAAMSFLQDIKSSQGKPFELYPKGSPAEAMCMCSDVWDEALINGFN